MKLHILNGLVVAGLIAASLMMPMIASSLAESQTGEPAQAALSQPRGDTAD